MASVVATTLASRLGGWRTGFTCASFVGAEYDALVAALVTEPSSKMLLNRAVSSGALHGDEVTDFPIDAALSAIGILIGNLPSATLVVARDQITHYFPVPATIDYIVAVTREPGVATYTVALPGTLFGNALLQGLTDVNPLCSDFELRIDGTAYQHSFWQGFFASVASGASSPIIRILQHLSASVKAVKEACGCDEEHRLVIAGYSLGATQALLFAMLLCDDSMQQTVRTLGISTDAFASTTVLLLAMPNAVRSGDTCAYVKRGIAKVGIKMYAVCDPLDIVEHTYAALPLTRPAVPHVYTLQDGKVYRIDAACATHGAMFGVFSAMSTSSFMPWNWSTLAKTVWRMGSVVVSAHMIVEYERKLRAIRDRR